MNGINHLKKIFLCLWAFCLWVSPPAAMAAEEIPASMADYTDDNDADGWFKRDSDSFSKDPEGWLERQRAKQKKLETESGTENSAAPAEKESDEKSAKKKAPERYQVIYQDDNFTYWLDTENARYIKLPYSQTENIIDAWVRMRDTSGEANYSYPEKYYLEHYYIRPARQQIQFLCELEVTGRPENAIREREYSVKNWENLVPGSVEDNIYKGVILALKNRNKKKFYENLPSFKSIMDEWFNVAL